MVNVFSWWSMWLPYCVLRDIILSCGHGNYDKWKNNFIMSIFLGQLFLLFLCWCWLIKEVIVGLGWIIIFIELLGCAVMRLLGKRNACIVFYGSIKENLLKTDWFRKLIGIWVILSGKLADWLSEIKGLSSWMILLNSVVQIWCRDKILLIILFLITTLYININSHIMSSTIFK